MPKITPMSEFDKQLCERIFFSLPGLSDTQIGDLLRLKRQSVQGWRSGKSRPTLEQISTISKETKISWSWYTTGLTTDYFSVSYAFFPIHYDKTRIIDITAYNYARNIAAKLLATANDRLFLPILNYLYNSAHTLNNNMHIYKLLNNAKFLNDYITIADKIKTDAAGNFTVKFIDELYKAYTPLPSMSSLKLSHKSGSICHNSERCYAYTSFDDIGINGEEHLSNFNNSVPNEVQIIGENMSPVICANQSVLTGSSRSLSLSADSQPLLSVIKLSQNSEYNKESCTSKTIRLCRYISIIADRFILTDNLNRTKPYVLNFDEVEAIRPITSVLWN